MNEKEVREGRGRNPVPLCSATSLPCECVAGGGCKAHESLLDKIPAETVRELATLRLHLGICKDDCDRLAGFADYYRKYPQPEIRDIRLKLVTIQSMIDELIGARR